MLFCDVISVTQFWTSNNCTLFASFSTPFFNFKSSSRVLHLKHLVGKQAKKQNYWWDESGNFSIESLLDPITESLACFCLRLFLLFSPNIYKFNRNALPLNCVANHGGEGSTIVNYDSRAVTSSQFDKTGLATDWLRLDTNGQFSSSTHLLR